MKTLDAGNVFLQETKLYTKGQIKIPSFVIFETNRNQMAEVD